MNIEKSRGSFCEPRRVTGVAFLMRGVYTEKPAIPVSQEPSRPDSRKILKNGSVKMNEAEQTVLPRQPGNRIGKSEYI